MKKLLLAFVLCGLAVTAGAQTTPTDLKKRTEIKTIPARLVQKPVLTKELAQPIEQLPDLRITALTVSYQGDVQYSDGPKHKIQIRYTIKNEGSKAFDLSKLSVQGWISSDPNYPMGMAGCGNTLTTIVNSMLNPGETAQGEFYCFSKFTIANNLYYTLYLDPGNSIRELSEENNSAKQTILF